ncbi:MAG: DUF3021 domain-containing protein [Oceanivirga sp.]|nr:DUF3021 domain-containing protein [Oceanivirga sp.]
MNILKKIFTGISIGLFIGVSLTIFFNLINNSEIYYATNPEFYKSFDNHLVPTIIAFVCYGIIGLVSIFVNEIYQTNKISLLPKNLFNVIVMYITLFIIGKYLCWFSDSKSIISNFVIFIIMYMFIWIIKYNLVKKDIEKINKNLKK